MGGKTVKKLPFVLLMLALAAVIIGASCAYATQPGDELTFSTTIENVVAEAPAIAADHSPPDIVLSAVNITNLFNLNTWSTSSAPAITQSPSPVSTMSNDYFRPTTAPALTLGTAASPTYIIVQSTGDKEESGGSPREVAFVYIGNELARESVGFSTMPATQFMRC